MSKLNLACRASYDLYDSKYAIAVAFLVLGKRGRLRQQLRRAIKAARPLWA